MSDSEVPSVGDEVYVEALGKSYIAAKDAGSCVGCAGHNRAWVCGNLPDCSTRTVSMIYKEKA